MGGKRSGISRKRRVLPRSLTAGSLSRVDRRSRAVRHVLDGAAQVLDDQGGDDGASLLLKRAAHRVMHLDQLLAEHELRIASGQPIDQAAYLSAATTWLRYAQAIGLTRVAKRVQRLHEYAASQSVLQHQSEHEGASSSASASGNGDFAHGHPEAPAEDPAATSSVSVPSPDAGDVAAGEVGSHE